MELKLETDAKQTGKSCVNMKLGADVATALGERVMGAQINAAGV